MGNINIAQYTSSDYKEHRQFWENQLSLSDEKYAFDRFSNIKQNGRDTQQVMLSKVEFDVVKGLVKSNDVGVFVVLISLLNLVLYKYGRKQEVIINIPPFAKNKSVNDTIPLVLSLSGTEQLKELLQFCQEKVSGGFKYQDFPLQLIDNSGSSLSNIAATYDEIHDTSSPLSDDLVFQFQNKGEELAVILHYDAAYFPKAYIAQLLTHFTTAVSFLKKLNTPINELQLLLKEEYKVLTQDFVSTGINYPKDKQIHQWFEQMADQYSDATALKCEGQQFTYNELNAQANALAHHLISQGVTPNDIVALMCERSTNMIVGMLAILKAGATYLPIDPDYPEDRIRYTLEDSEAPFLVVDEANSDKVITKSTKIKLEERAVDQHNPNVKIDPSDVAYIIYTSGSTGNPKGVMVQHSNVVRLFFNDEAHFDFNEKDVWTMFHSFCFDFSVWEMYGALLFGGTLIVVPKRVAQNTNEYYNLLREEKVTVLNQTPGAFYKLIESDQKGGNASSIRYVIFGGEALRPVKLKSWNEKYPKCQLINMYGITETTVHVTYKEITTAEIESNVSNIGKAIPTLQTYILDEHHQPVPLGVVGELCIAGDGVAKGYLNREELTNEKFIPNPFGEGKLYTSGDLGRYLPDGEIEYLGRIDHQVKIRGYRIELGEIENTLLRLPEIEQAFVTATTGDQDNFLSAYLVAKEVKSVAEMRESLAETLPDYMIPSYFVFLEEFPLTSNGKIDRKSLPNPQKQIASSAEYVAPETEVEKTVCRLFQEILKVERVGMLDSFFELGGHSLKATTLISMIQAELEVAVPLGEIFTNPTPKAISTYISGADRQTIISIEKADERGHYPLSSAQKRLFILNQFEGNNTTYNMPIIMRVEGKLESDKIQQVVDALVNRHESLRTTFELKQGEPTQTILPEHKVEVEMFSASETEANDIVGEFIRPFDIAKEVLRVGVVQISPTQSILMIDMHHIVSDGMSMGVLTNEFIELYSGISLDPLQLQYKDYAVWQNRQFEEGNIQKQEEFWLSEFNSGVPVMDFPLDFPRPSMQRFEGANKSFEVPTTLAEKLRQMASETSVSMFILLLAAYNVLLSKYARQEDIVVGSPTAGRKHSDLKSIIGIFVNTIAIRSYPEQKKSFKAFLSEVKETVLQCIENDDYQFEELLDKLALKRDLSRNPLFDVMFTYQNAVETERSIEDLIFAPFQSENNISKFDFTLGVTDFGEGIHFNVEYCTRLFKQDTVEQLAKHFLFVLEQIVQDKETLLKDIDLCNENEKELILTEFSSARVDHPTNKLVPELFEATVSEYSENVALVESGKSLTYAELNAKSNQLAHKMIEKGIGKKDIVAIICTPSIEMFIGIMATLKTGAAYLPVDPEYPQERITYMVQNSKAKAIITDFTFTDFEGITINVSQEALYEGNDQNPKVNISGSDNAYIIYTSGSTGNPKGVVIQHDAFLNVVNWNRFFYEITAKDISTKYSGVGFDASVIEIFPYLVSGASLHIVPKEVRLDAEKLNDYFNEHHISISFLPTQIAEHFMEYENTSLRCLTTGGDKLKVFKKQNYVLYNTYGPTENAVDATYFLVDQDYHNIPIGKPIDNVETYILTSDNKIQPIGVPGELCIGGESLAKEYLFNPTLTKEKFVANPFEKGTKMYRTGDLVRWLSDGNMEFLGRIDNQVQIRGFRIELGEIEHQIAKHPAISEVTVIDKNEQNGDKFLAAFFTSDEELTSTEIRQYIKISLPEYMIPSYFVQLDKMPVTQNGKTDRKQLATIALSGKLASGIEYVEPNTDTEKALAKIWSEVLNVEKVGIKDNFFELGGNSLKIVRLLKLVEGEFPGIVQIGNLFDHATIEQLGKLIDEAGQEENAEEEQEIRVVDF